MSLTGKTLAATYKDILQVDNSNNGVDTTLRNVKDGEGTSSSLFLSDDVVRVVPQNDNTTASLEVRANGGGTVLSVNTTSELVVASGNTVNTQYAYFMVDGSDSSSFLANTHYAIPFQGGMSAVGYPPAFGTSTDPGTTFTTAEANGTRGQDIVPMLWLVPDAITIDSIKGFEGADSATGDTTRMHLFSYDFTSGSTSCLTNGTLLAHNSDVTNAGDEQAYLSTFTIDSANVAANKVILAFLRSDSVNSDYAINLTVKYHLT